MAEPFLSEIRMMSFQFRAAGWALCDGQLLPINQNQALFSLLGTTFGGDGRVNFGAAGPARQGPDSRRRRAHARRARRRAGAHAEHRRVANAHPCGVWNVELDGPQRHQHPDGQPAGQRSERDLRRRGFPGAHWAHPWCPTVGGSPGPRQHAAVSHIELLHRSAGHLPSPNLKEAPWRNRMWERSGCSPAISHPPAGCSAKASSCRSAKTKPCSS